MCRRLLIWINGRRRTCVHALDRGCLYGDGVFETFLVTAGVPMFWEEHLQRLQRGCGRLGIPMPAAALLRREALGVCRRGGSGVLRLQLSRGRGGRGYGPSANLSPTRVISFHPLPADLQERRLGVQVRLCHTPLGINPHLAGIKHCNRLEQVLARREWNDPAIYEGLMCDTEGYLVEGTMTNLFWTQGGRLLTPKVDRCGVAGIARAWVLERVREWGLSVEETRVTPVTLREADEVFLSNSVAGIVPVLEWVGECRWQPGFLARRLQEAWP